MKPGYFGKLREPGDAFDVPDGAKASWFAPASVVQHAPRVNKAPKPPADKHLQGSDDKSGGDLV
ncbi:hypothetical protein L527_2102 [Bordetella bronchiseptica MBORD839]|uniref:Bbp15 n=1 Tax=Bordetella bronchiseptica 253 TaxID=568707 RepID=A0A0H3NZY6_BORBO|nr:hypothetical protein L528_2227 [Bordetella bronchiseptica MBORD849]KDD39425.1 hypothetical protein L527_2102 [Bordetella bronchiseptica MBORD839]CCJ51977.1 bbp15 [Bordetella bronchiseptica 253]CCJ53216.1 bbp15 [Bordetella bronchiseptica 253]